MASDLYKRLLLFSPNIRLETEDSSAETPKFVLPTLFPRSPSFRQAVDPYDEDIRRELGLGAADSPYSRTGLGLLGSSSHAGSGYHQPGPGFLRSMNLPSLNPGSLGTTATFLTGNPMMGLATNAMARLFNWITGADKGGTDTQTRAPTNLPDAFILDPRQRTGLNTLSTSMSGSGGNFMSGRGMGMGGGGFMSPGTGSVTIRDVKDEDKDD